MATLTLRTETVTRAPILRSLKRPKTKLEEFRRGIEAWKQFKQLSQQLAHHNAQTLKQKGVQGP